MVGRGTPVAVQFRLIKSPMAAVTLVGCSRNEGETVGDGGGMCEGQSSHLFRVKMSEIGMECVRHVSQSIQYNLDFFFFFFFAGC